MPSNQEFLHVGNGHLAKLPPQLIRNFKPQATATIGSSYQILKANWYYTKHWPHANAGNTRCEDTGRYIMVHHHLVPWLFTASLALSYEIYTLLYTLYIYKHIYIIYTLYIIYVIIIYVIYTYLELFRSIVLSHDILIESDEIPLPTIRWAERAHDFVVWVVPSPGAERVAKPTARASAKAVLRTWAGSK